MRQVHVYGVGEKKGRERGKRGTEAGEATRGSIEGFRENLFEVKEELSSAKQPGTLNVRRQWWLLAQPISDYFGSRST